MGSSKFICKCCKHLCDDFDAEYCNNCEESYCEGFCYKDHECKEVEEALNPYELWLESYKRAADHLLLSAILRKYYDQIDEITVDKDSNSANFANLNFELEMSLNRNLVKNEVFDLYELRTKKNLYINSLKELMIGKNTNNNFSNLFNITKVSESLVYENDKNEE